MLSGIKSESGVDVDGLSLLGHEDVSLFGTKQVLLWGFGMIAHGSGTKNFVGRILVWMFFIFEFFFDDELISGGLKALLVVPPEDSSIS